MTESATMVATVEHKQLCTLQKDLASLASEKCATEDFEDRWRACGAEKRQQHYFEAMVHICEIPDMEEQRLFAPEITLKALQARDGEGYLDLLRRLMPQASLTDQYILIENSVIDSMLELRKPFDTTNSVPTDPLAFVQKVSVMRRCLFISLSVWSILLSFYGISEPFVSVKSKGSVLGNDFQEWAKSRLGKKTLRTMVKETKQAKKLSRWACSHCNKLEVDVGEAFKSCSRCMTIGRKVMYCGRDCQVEDWKNGKPPHKIICGKPSTPGASNLAAPAPPKAGSIPPAAPNFRRPPALLHQISLLEENPTLDYALVKPAPRECDQGIVMQAASSLLFRVMRDRAFRDGDESAVLHMFRALEPMASSFTGYGVVGLEKQLKLEFGVDVRQADQTPRRPDVSAEELRACVANLPSEWVDA